MAKAENSLVPAARVSLEKYRKRFPGSNELFDRAVRAAHEHDAEIRKMQSPKGALGLSAHLDARRLEYGITDGAFKFQPAYDRVLVHQLEDIDQMLGAETFVPGGQVVKTDTQKKVGWETSPQGVLVAAGLTAMDSLASHGIELGDVVDFVMHAPFRKRVDVTPSGHDRWVIILRAGDLIGSADLASRIFYKACSVQYDQEAMQHYLIGKDGKRWDPKEPWTSEDY